MQWVDGEYGAKSLLPLHQSGYGQSSTVAMEEETAPSVKSITYATGCTSPHWIGEEFGGLLGLRAPA